MEFKEVIEKRRSTRKFEERPVDRAVAERIMQIVLTAPSARNTRTTRLLAIDDREVIKRIASMRDYGSAFVEGAPLVIAVMGDRTGSDLWVDNAAISATIMQLAAVDEGLASCWVHVNGRPRLKDDPSAGTAEQYLRTFLPIPDEWSVLCMVAIGYAAAQPKPLPEHDDSTAIAWL